MSDQSTYHARRILVTGGAGYIGSHAVLALLKAGYDVVVIDNFVNGSREAVRRVEALAGRAVTLITGDVADRAALDTLFEQYTIDAVMHFAGLKAVGDSVARPLAYYANNVTASLTLLHAMAKAGVTRLIFSSSATVYDVSSAMPLHEASPTGQPATPYGRSKLMIEQILTDTAAADEAWQIGILRYFNPIGAHDTGQIGEAPQGVPNNLAPYISQVAVGRRDSLAVFGDDYPTRDGTGVRDYIHVMDLVEGHIAALDALAQQGGVQVWNLGTGRGTSVLELLAAFEQEIGHELAYHVAPRRAGDVAECWSDPSKAQRELGWAARRDLASMVADAWRWQRDNPAGYD